jgi:UDP-N-acetyl-D-mannosaminuronic acid dehydrogenase
MLIADAGHRVIGLDTDAELVKAIEHDQFTPREPGTEAPYRKACEEGRFTATLDASVAVTDAEVVVIIVPVPVDSDHRPDLTNLERACAAIGPHLSRDSLVVVESTLPPGTMEGVVRAALEQASGLTAGRDFFLAHSPERVMAGTIVEQMRSYPKVIGALTATGRQRAERFYTTFCPSVLAMPNLISAELGKVVEGVYRDVNIALANHLARVCEDLGADFTAVHRAANSQPYCHLHRPSAGVGGLCIPVYPYFLPSRGQSDLVRACRAYNEIVPRFVAERTLELSGESATILTLGLAFRAGIRDMRLSPSLEIITTLREAGRTVRVMDPNYTSGEIMSACGCASKPVGDFILVLTAEDAFANILIDNPDTPSLDCTGRFPQATYQLGRNIA